jgi:hypothetical protein
MVNLRMTDRRITTVAKESFRLTRAVRIDNGNIIAMTNSKKHAIKQYQNSNPSVGPDVFHRSSSTWKTIIPIGSENISRGVFNTRLGNKTCRRLPFFVIVGIVQ